MRRASRLMAMAAMVLGLAGTSLPAAHATSVADVTFTGTARIDCGLGYPLPPADPTAGPTCGFRIESELCVSEETSTKKTAVLAGTCVFAGAGVVTGYCGLSTGSGTATVTSTSAVLTPGVTQTYTVDFTFTGVGGTLVVTGTATKGGTSQTGPFGAVVEAAPPTPVTNPQGGSCLNNNATEFNLAGNGLTAVS